MTITIRGREYSVTIKPIEEKFKDMEGSVRYVLAGKRGAVYSTFRNAHKPHLMFLMNMRLTLRGMEGVWLSDETGELKVVKE